MPLKKIVLAYQRFKDINPGGPIFINKIMTRKRDKNKLWM